MYTNRVILGVALVLNVARSLLAGSVSVPDTIAIQSLTTDMVAASINDLSGLDYASSFTYSGNFSQSGWSGTFGGIYQGSPVSGTTAATISGDPNYNISGGSSYSYNDGKKFDGTLNFPLVQNNDKFTMDKGTFGGGISTYTWSSMNLKKTEDAKNDNYDGTVTGTSPNGKQETWTFHISIARKSDGTFHDMTSRFTRQTGRPVTIYDKGQATYEEKVGGNFNGAMNESVALVPEPSSFVIACSAIAAAIGYSAVGRLRCQIRKRGRGHRSRP